MAVTVPGGTLSLNVRRVTQLSWPTEAPQVDAGWVLSSLNPFTGIYFINLYLDGDVTADYGLSNPVTFTKDSITRSGTLRDNGYLSDTTVDRGAACVTGYSTPDGYTQIEWTGTTIPGGVYDNPEAPETITVTRAGLLGDITFLRGNVICRDLFTSTYAGGTTYYEITQEDGA